MSDAADDLGSPPSSSPVFGPSIDKNPLDAQDASSLRFTAQPVTHVRLRLQLEGPIDPSHALDFTGVQTGTQSTGSDGYVPLDDLSTNDNTNDYNNDNGNP